MKLGGSAHATGVVELPQPLLGRADPGVDADMRQFYNIYGLYIA